MRRLVGTMHWLARKQQRGFRGDDAERILSAGTEISECEVMVTNKDADREIHRLKREIRRWERLRNRKIVTAGDRIITGYETQPSHQKVCLRRARRFANYP